MALSQEEKSLVQEAIQVYLQIVSRQMPQQHVKKIAQIAENALKKIDTLNSGTNSSGKPEGITDEWYNNVCKTCSKLSSTGCTDKVTEKFPGKCDPILHYEQDKLRS
jgi:hypothetical protein